MKARGGILPTVLAVAAAAVPAEAEWVVTPSLGINLAGDAEFRRGGPGGSVGFFGDRLGFEFDIQRYHHFFKDENVDLVPNNCGPGLVPGAPCIDLNTDAWGVMGNVVAPFRGGGAKWRPYGTAGFGVVHAWVEGPGDQYDVEQDDLALNVGGGVMYSLNGRVGLRGDLRYVHAFVDEDKREGGYFKDYGFLRATVGFTFSFRRR
jgi:outer membrane protein with beta-barrel domain